MNARRSAEHPRDIKWQNMDISALSNAAASIAWGNLSDLPNTTSRLDTANRNCVENKMRHVLNSASMFRIAVR